VKNPKQIERWISRARPRSGIVALALAVALSTVMAATPSAQAQTFTVLYAFQGPHFDGASPGGELIFDRLGNIYGTTRSEGRGGAGTVFKLDSSGKETVLYNFGEETADGAGPTGALVRYAGNIYGTTVEGGRGCAPTFGCGTVFELTHLNIHRNWTIHSFAGFDGNGPNGLISAEDRSGNLYGTTRLGGAGTGCDTSGCGTVFEVSQGQAAVLYNFSGTPDAASPVGSLIVDRLGNIYGTTIQGGTFNQGSVFELSPNSDGTWTEHVLYSFTGRDGAQPYSGVIMDVKGALFGATRFGGHSGRSCEGCGVVFKLVQNPDGSWTERILHNFDETRGDGIQPVGNIVRDKQGNIYGVTVLGGTKGKGVVFKVDAEGQETVLHSFTGNRGDGNQPGAGLTMDESGNLYGTTLYGGDGCPQVTGIGCGTVFKITP
jgi:uncharacterized repeat protein (TIGR03803 family)